MLAEDVGLARNVLSLELHAVRGCQTGLGLHPPWINFEMFKGVVNLRDLSFSGFNVGSNEDLRLLLNNVPALKSLKMKGCCRLGDEFDIAGLDELQWTREYSRFRHASHA